MDARSSSTQPLDVPALQAAAAGPPAARLVVLFGSVARGCALGWSDVDVGASGASFWDGLEIGCRVGKALGREPHMVDLDRASELLRFQVARDGILLREGAPGAWASFRAEAVLRHFDLQPIIRLCASGVRRRLAREAEHG